MVWSIDDPITIAIASGVGAGAQAVAWRLSRARSSAHWRTLAGGAVINCFAGSAIAMIVGYFWPKAPLLIIGTVWVICWAFDFSRDDTRAQWSSRLMDLAEMVAETWIKSRNDKSDKDNQP